MPLKKLFKFVTLAVPSGDSEDAKLPEWCDHLANAFILAGVGLFTTMGGVLASGAETTWQAALPASIISAGIQFFLSLAAQRGIKQRKE